MTDSGYKILGGEPQPSDLGFNVRTSSGRGRLPVYLLIDISKSMEGNRLASLVEGIDEFLEQMRENCFASDTVHLGVITFGGVHDRADNLTPNGLIPVDDYELPALKADKATPLGEAFKLLNESIDKHVIKYTPGQQKGDFKPLVFVFTDGRPTDSNHSWKIHLKAVNERPNRKVYRLVAVGIGDEIEDDILKEIAPEHCYRIRDVKDAFATLLAWVAQTVTSVAQACSLDDQSSAKTPLLPGAITYIADRSENQS